MKKKTDKFQKEKDLQDHKEKKFNNKPVKSIKNGISKSK